MKIVTCVAPVNIAVIKYWGKRNEELILPINDSLSATLNTDFMSAKTTILASPELKENKFWLNGKEESFDNPRLANCLKDIRERAKEVSPELLTWNIAICSENNFPTAAGLASSAAGYACLVAALAKLYNIQGDISSIARRGSGSACRSVYGGFVRWHKGELKNGEDSIAEQLVPASHWPEMRILILVVNDKKKKDPSTLGMKRGVETSNLLKYRADHIVPKRIEEISRAIVAKDFHTFARLTMQDSNQFHATCLDTYPPCVYMNDVSHAIAEVVHKYNEYYKVNKVAYTFDAGPNACLYLLEENVEEFLSVVNYVFPPPDVDQVEYLTGLPINPTKINNGLVQSLNVAQNKPGVLKYIIHTNVGEGPKTVDDHLLNGAGVPLK
ncbi:diphosphomevalonate decarboxylase [Aethina tumida]|uniref:diphosphomevalonate decarboxylase n=1 Tax=Aethina tumida TaxID=116153 RepID=UPI00096AFA7B|nr:diphosphomevalonate decarboxylase [Aethina tumida]